MSLTDIFGIIQSGGPDAIFLLLLFCALWIRGVVYAKREVDYRDSLLAKQDTMLTRQQDLFDQALGLLKEQPIQRKNG